jgi:glycerol-3-phosphate acyltransferase PlsY
MILKLTLLLLFSYFYGTILFAIPITKLFINEDIRKIGNTNPGTSNVFKNVGILPGIIVFILDFTKGLVPMILMKTFLLPPINELTIITESGYWLIITTSGIMAILGHTRPYWNKFKKGGGGMGTAIGMFAFLAPFEYLVSFILGVLTTYTFMKNSNYKVGRWAVMIATFIMPFITLTSNYFFEISLFSHYNIGIHSSGIFYSIILIILTLLILNRYKLTFWIKDPASQINPRRDGSN